MPEKLRMKFRGAETSGKFKMLKWEALSHGYANYAALRHHPIQRGDFILISADYFWRGQETWLVDTAAVHS